MDTSVLIARMAEKYLRVVENHYVMAVIGILLIFTVLEDIKTDWESGIDNFKLDAEHGLFFVYLNLFLISTARICKAYVHHKKTKDVHNS